MISTTPQRDFILGEEKYIDFRIASHKEQAVVVSDAYYNLYDGSQIVETGACEVDGSYVSALLKPPYAGTFLLEIMYTVPPETRKVKVVIRVN